jgi:hypothetical protein
MIRARFNVNLGQVRQRIGDKVVLVQKKVAMQVLEGVVNMTPVDTGRARGNWMVTLGQPTTTFDWETKDKAGGETIAHGTQMIQQIVKPGAVYITNNLPYIVGLEKGRSGQAPSGMVAVTLDRVALQFRAA